MTVGVLCAVVAAAIILVTIIILYREGKELMRVESAIRHLGDLDLSADRALEAFYDRTDEIGLIAQTTHRLCECLRKTVEDIGRILGEMAEGNIAVDVRRNEAYYIGDFKVLADNLKTIRTDLTDVMSDISHIADQVATGACRVSDGLRMLSEGTTKQSSEVDGLVLNVTEITSQIKSSAVRCGNASELVDKANGYAAEADAMMAQLTVATENISQSSAKISSIIRTIEDIAFQTNILALNASIEAAHAGTAGKGFSVVAEEVRSLATRSGQAAQDTSTLIDRSVQDIRVGTQANSAEVGESAEVSRELSDQARTLNSLIGRFRIE